MFELDLKNILEILVTLNKLVEPMKGKKIKDFGDELHESVIALIDDYCKQLGILPKIWYISSPEQHLTLHENTHVNYSDLFIYRTPNFKKDKRVKYGSRGTVDKVVFEFVHPEIAAKSITLEEYIKNLKIAYLEKRIEILTMSNVELNKSIQENDSTMRELINEVQVIGRTIRS